MSNLTFDLKATDLTREQTQFFVDAFLKATDVEFAPFGDTKTHEEFKELVTNVPAIFGEGAEEASAEAMTRGWTYSGAVQIQLCLLHFVFEMSAAGNPGMFIEASNSYDSYFDELLPWMLKHEIDTDD